MTATSEQAGNPRGTTDTFTDEQKRHYIAGQVVSDPVWERFEAVRGALERLTHESCGTNRVPQSVRWARQALGWSYDKGCQESVEAVRKAYQERADA